MTHDVYTKRGWYCTRKSPHNGPCALVPRWWNIKWRYFVR